MRASGHSGTVLFIAVWLTACSSSDAERTLSDAVSVSTFAAPTPAPTPTLNPKVEVPQKRPHRVATGGAVAIEPETGTVYQARMLSLTETQLVAFSGAMPGRVVASSFVPLAAIAALGQQVCWAGGGDVTCKLGAGSARVVASTQERPNTHRLPPLATATQLLLDGDFLYVVERHQEPRRPTQGSLIQLDLRSTKGRVLLSETQLDVAPVATPQGVFITTQRSDGKELRIIRLDPTSGQAQTFADLAGDAPEGYPFGLAVGADSVWVGIQSPREEDFLLRISLTGGSAVRAGNLSDWTPGWGVSQDGLVVRAEGETRIVAVNTAGVVVHTIDVGAFDRLLVSRAGWFYHPTEGATWLRTAKP